MRFLSSAVSLLGSQDAPLSVSPHNTQPLVDISPACRQWFSSFPRAIPVLCVITMGKTPASTRAGRKSKPKLPERKWCSCQERCGGGKDVAASTYRSHNPTARAAATRDGSKDDPVAVVGGKRKAGSDADRLGSEGGPRETRRMRAMRIAQGGESMSQPSLAVTEGLTGRLGLGDVRPQGSKTVGRMVRQAFIRED